MNAIIKSFKDYMLKHNDTLTLEALAALVAFASWLDTFVKDAKTRLSVEYGTGKHTCGAFTVSITETSASVTVKGVKELAAMGITPQNKPELFKEKSGSIRVSVK